MKRGFGLVCFGTSVLQARADLSALDRALTNLLDHRWLVNRSFSSAMIRRKLARGGEAVASPLQMAADMHNAGVTHLFLQPTYLTSGYEQDDLLGLAAGLRALKGKCSFDAVAVGRPLMTDEVSIHDLADCLVALFAPRLVKGEGLLLMGHGTDHPGGRAYVKLAAALAERDPRFALACVEGKPPLEPALERLKDQGVTRLVLAPLMMVAGEHARVDMAGPEPESWLNQAIAAGFASRVILEGLGGMAPVQALMARRMQEDLAALGSSW